MRLKFLALLITLCSSLPFPGLPQHYYDDFHEYTVITTITNKEEDLKSTLQVDFYKSDDSNTVIASYKASLFGEKFPETELTMQYAEMSFPQPFLVDAGTQGSFARCVVYLDKERGSITVDFRTRKDVFLGRVFSDNFDEKSFVSKSGEGNFNEGE